MRLRYVTLHHTGIASPHFDFLFEMEAGEPLMSFRCPRWPPDVGDRWEELEPHRAIYLDYEGPVSNDRGQVVRVDAGHLTLHVVLEQPLTIGLTLTGPHPRQFTLTGDPDAPRSRETAWVVLTHLETPPT
jgi:hypothetical protein